MEPETEKTPTCSKAGDRWERDAEGQAFSSSLSAKLLVLMPPSEPLTPL